LGGDFLFCGGRQHRKTFYGFGGYVLQASKFPEGSYVTAIVAGIVDGSFGEESSSG
jgi:hypothetical protein